MYVNGNVNLYKGHSQKFYINKVIMLEEGSCQLM